VEPIFYVQIGEPKALLTAISEIIKLGFDNFIFTTDFKIVVDGLTPSISIGMMFMNLLLSLENVDI